MSIYSTLWTLKFPIYGDDHTGCDWIEVFAQGVPAHVGLDESYPEDPYADFLPAEVAQWTAGYGHLVLLGGDAQPEDSSLFEVLREHLEPLALRAVVIVTAGTPKGTARSGQEYESPLVVQSGREYLQTSFQSLQARICDALRGGRPRVIGEIRQPDGSVKVLYEDHSAIVVPAPNGGLADSSPEGRGA